MSLSVLAQNLKIIRKNLCYTQMTISKVLDIGLRTYVRYETGERDVPLRLVIKFARLGNLSLDRLLTTKLTPENIKIPDIEIASTKVKQMEVIGGSIKEGRIMFMGLSNDYLITTNRSEKKLINYYRKLNRLEKEKCLVDSEWILNNPKSVGLKKPLKRLVKIQKTKNK